MSSWWVNSTKRATARERKEGEDFSNADIFNPTIWEAEIKALLNIKEAFRDADWYVKYQSTKKMLAEARRYNSKKANN